MRKLVFASLILLGACSKKGDYEKACNHMIDLAYAELDEQTAALEKLGGDTANHLKDLRKEAEAKRGSDLKTCIEKSEEHKVDADCVLKAGKLDDLKGCGIGGF